MGMLRVPSIRHVYLRLQSDMFRACFDRCSDSVRNLICMPWVDRYMHCGWRSDGSARAPSLATVHHKVVDDLSHRALCECADEIAHDVQQCLEVLACAESVLQVGFAVMTKSFFQELAEHEQATAGVVPHW